MLRYTLVALLLASSDAFQFMSNWKITPPADIEKEAATKAKFGDKSKFYGCVFRIFHLVHSTIARSPNKLYPITRQN